MNFTKLSGTTRLFLMTIICTSRLSNCFTIWNLRFIELNLQLFVVFQTPFQCTQMEFSLTVYQNLTQFLRLFYNPSRVFFTHTVQHRHHLFCVGFIYRLDSSRILRIRIFNEIESVLTILAIQGIARLHIFQFYCTANISRTQFVYFFTVGTCTYIKLCHTFFRTSVCVAQIIAFMHHTTHYFKVLYISDMRFHSCLKEVK